MFVATRARAAPDTVVALEYEVAADLSGCPDVEEFGANVKRQLGFDPFRTDADRRVVVQIARKEIGYDGRIRWSDPSGRWVGDRKLKSRSADCREIGASLAFSVAVQIQLLAALAAPAPEPAAPPPPPPSPPPPETDTTLVAPAPLPVPPPRRLSLFVGLGPALAVGLAPEKTGLGRLFVSGRHGAVSLEAAVDAALPTSRQAVDGSGFSLDRFAAGAAGCGHADPLLACVTATGGVLRARGAGVDAPAAPTGWFSQVGARIAWRQDFAEHYFASARVDGLVMLSPWTVTLNQTAAWTTPRVAALFGLDLGIRFF